jgi:hypothetical protein
MSSLSQDMTTPGHSSSTAGGQADGDSPRSPITVVMEDGIVQIVGSSGETEELRHFCRSTTIMDMSEAEAGTSVMPVTRSGIELWQEAVDSMLSKEIWHLKRAVELALVAQV